MREAASVNEMTATEEDEEKERKRKGRRARKRQTVSSRSMQYRDLQCGTTEAATSGRPV